MTTVRTAEELKTEAALRDGCDAGDFSQEGFEGLLGDEIDAILGNFAIGFPEAGFQFPSGMILEGAEPNVDLRVFDLAEGSVRFTLGDNGDIAVRFACASGDRAGLACSEDDDCSPEESSPEAACEREIVSLLPDLPTGTAYATTNGRDVESITFSLPPSDTCSAVGMYISSFDGVEVTLTALNGHGGVIDSASFSTVLDPDDNPDGFIGVVGPSAPTIRGFRLSSSESFAFDEILLPTPEPSGAAQTIAALAALVALSSRRRRKRTAVSADA